MSQQLMDLVEKANLKAELPYFEIGDTVDVHCRILEGEKNASFPCIHHGSPRSR